MQFKSFLRIIAWGLLGFWFMAFSFDAVGQEGATPRTLSLADLIERVEPSCARLDMTLRGGKAIGSGFIVESNWLVTNHHVVAGATKGVATFADGTTAEIEGVLAADKGRDIAVLRLKTERKFTPLKLATKVPRKGEATVAIGAPSGLSFTATEGIVSAIRDGAELKAFGAEAEGQWLQTSTPISPGSSGGPLLNLQGEVVGASSAGLASAQNLNFAISAGDIKYVMSEAAKQKVQPFPKGEVTRRPTRSSGPTSAPPAEPIVCKLPVQRKFGHRYRVGVEEDEFDKVTWLRTQWFPVKHKDPRLGSCDLRACALYSDGVPAPIVLWELATTSKGFAFFGEEGKRFQIVFDQESVSLSEPQYKNELLKGGIWNEKLTSVFRLDHFLQVVMAKEVKARVGKTEYELSPDQLECLRDLASRLPEGKSPEGEFIVERRDLDDDPTVPPAVLRAERAKMKKGATGKGAKSEPKAEPSSESKESYRTWKTADGKFTVEAKLLAADEDQVHLLRKDTGKAITVPLDKLSPEDRDWVRKAK